MPTMNKLTLTLCAGLGLGALSAVLAQDDLPPAPPRLGPPPTAPLGQIVMGSTRSQQLHDFLVSQEVQPYVEINTSWLDVGHIDEVVGFTSASTVALADPADAYNLLNHLPKSAVFFSTDSAPPATGTASMASAANTGTLVTNNITWSGTDWQYIRVYSGTGAGQVGLIAPGGITISGTSATITLSGVWNTGSRIVDGDNHSTTSIAAYALGQQAAPRSSLGWFQNVSPGDNYVLAKGTKNWVFTDMNGNQQSTPAIVTVQEVLADANLSAVNLTDVPVQSQSIKSALNTAAGAGTINFISVPTIYAGVDSPSFGMARSAVALTPGLANVQEIGTKLYFPKQFGPRDVGGNDVFEQETLTRYPNAVFVDDWDLYHRLQGEVHCGTAMKRQPFSFNWWQKQP